VNLNDLKVPRAAIPQMAEAAMRVTRLLKNNPRELTLSDAIAVYERAF
jgi:alcohol dehydrogenase class IV